MLIDDYFQQQQQLVSATSLVQTARITYESRTQHIGYIRGELYLIDGSVLHVREYVDVELFIERLTYAYHYMDAAGQFRFRYDNTDHHRHLNLPTHPHHKHDGDEARIISSPAPTLEAVLAEITTLLRVP